MQFTELSPRHNDLVHDISFDYYGKRFASCSSDKHIKVRPLWLSQLLIKMTDMGP
jgi:WD40 repeat protein